MTEFHSEEIFERNLNDEHFQNRRICGKILSFQRLTSL